jgi:hypothetical protein
VQEAAEAALKAEDEALAAARDKQREVAAQAVNEDDEQRGKE